MRMRARARARMKTLKMAIIDMLLPVWFLLLSATQCTHCKQFATTCMKPMPACVVQEQEPMECIRCYMSVHELAQHEGIPYKQTLKEDGRNLKEGEAIVVRRNAVGCKKEEAPLRIIESVSKGSNSVVQKVSARGGVFICKRKTSVHGAVKELEMMRKVPEAARIRVIDVFTDTPSRILALELHTMTARTHPHLVKVEHIVQMYEALDCIHKSGVLHADIKPSNVFLGSVPKVGDFGSAFPIESCFQQFRDVEPGCTLPYAPPEFLAKAPFSASADVWSMAVTSLYCLLGGTHPFRTSFFREVSGTTKALADIALVFGPFEGGFMAKAIKKDCIEQANRLALEHGRERALDFANLGREAKRVVQKLVKPSLTISGVERPIAEDVLRSWHGSWRGYEPV